MALGEKLREARLRKKLSTSEVAAATRMKTQTVDAIEREDFSKMPAPIYCKGFIRLYAEFIGIEPDPLIAEYVARCQENKPIHLSPPPDELPLPAITTTPPPKKQQAREQQPAPVQEPAPVMETPDLFAHAEKQQEKTQAHASIAAEPPAVETQPTAVEIPLVDESRPNAAELLKNFNAQQVSAAKETAREPANTGEQEQQESTPANGTLKTVSIIFGIIIVAVFLISIMSRCSKPRDPSEIIPDKTSKALKVVVPPPPTYAE